MLRFTMTMWRFLLNLAKQINIGKATKYVTSLRQGELLVLMPLLVAFLRALVLREILRLTYFGAVRFTQKSNSYILCPKTLSYSRTRELIKAIGVVAKGFSTHSLRAGGATFIAKNLIVRTDY